MRTNFAYDITGIPCSICVWFNLLILSHPWPKLTSFTMGDLDLTFCTKLVRLLNESKMPNLKVLRLSAKCKMKRNDDYWVIVEPGVNLNNLETDKLPHLESLTLYRMINFLQELRSLEEKLLTWKLKDFDIGHSRNITGSLSILLCHNFPSLITLLLRNCDLNLDDLSCIASPPHRADYPQFNTWMCLVTLYIIQCSI